MVEGINGGSSVIHDLWGKAETIARGGDVERENFGCNADGPSSFPGKGGGCCAATTPSAFSGRKRKRSRVDVAALNAPRLVTARRVPHPGIRNRSKFERTAGWSEVGFALVIIEKTKRLDEFLRAQAL